MKTAIFRFFSFCFALLLLAACSRDGQPFLPDDTGKDDGDIPVDIVVSRSTFTGAGDGGETDTKFTPGCHIGVSVDGSAAYQKRAVQIPCKRFGIGGGKRKNLLRGALCFESESLLSLPE